MTVGYESTGHVCLVHLVCSVDRVYFVDVVCQFIGFFEFFEFRAFVGFIELIEFEGLNVGN